MNRYFRFATLTLLGMCLLFADFFTKAYIYHLLPIMDYKSYYPYGGIGVFQDLFGVDFAIALAINRGAAWGVFADFQGLLLFVRMAVILGMILYLFFFNKDSKVEAPFVLIISGAIGNVIDFFLYGYVIDFLHFNFWGYHFPVFNVADSAITIGVSWLFLLACFQKKRLSSNV